MWKSFTEPLKLHCNHETYKVDSHFKGIESKGTAPWTIGQAGSYWVIAMLYCEDCT
jgi:hypothetical protein